MAVLPWTDSVIVLYRLWGLLSIGLAPNSKSTSLSISKQCGSYWSFCEPTGEKVLTVHHMESNLNKLLFEPFLFFPIAFLRYQFLGLPFPSEPILQISGMVPDNWAVTLKGYALQGKAKAGIMNQAKALWKSVKQLSVLIPACPLGWGCHFQTQMAYLIITLTKTNIAGLSNGERNSLLRKNKLQYSPCLCFYNIQGTTASAMEGMSLYKTQYMGGLLMVHLWSSL